MQNLGAYKTTELQKFIKFSLIVDMTFYLFCVSRQCPHLTNVYRKLECDRESVISMLAFSAYRGEKTCTVQ